MKHLIKATTLLITAITLCAEPVRFGGLKRNDMIETNGIPQEVFTAETNKLWNAVEDASSIDLSNVITSTNTTEQIIEGSLAIEKGIKTALIVPPWETPGYYDIGLFFEVWNNLNSVYLHAPQLHLHSIDYLSIGVGVDARMIFSKTDDIEKIDVWSGEFNYRGHRLATTNDLNNLKIEIMNDTNTYYDRGTNFVHRTYFSNFVWYIESEEIQ